MVSGEIELARPHVFVAVYNLSLALPGRGWVVEIVMVRSAKVDTMAGLTVSWALREPGEIVMYCWLMLTMVVRSGLATLPEKKDVSPANMGLVMALTTNSKMVSEVTTYCWVKAPVRVSTLFVIWHCTGVATGKGQLVNEHA